MPHSSDQGKPWMRREIWEALDGAPERFDEGGSRLAPRVLDIGAGAGAYADLLASTMPRRFLPHMTAVEIHEPYVERFGLLRKYDEVLLGDARTNDLPEADVVILGDVLEHMSFGDAKALWAKARAAATTAVFLSLPIVEWPQGAVDGNKHEAHLHSWTHASVQANLPGIVEWHLGEAIGAYRALPSRPAVGQP